MKKEFDIKKRLFTIAIKRFTEDGFSGTSLNEIAREAGISKSLIFWYFKSKKDLFDNIIDEMVSGLRVDIEKELMYLTPENKLLKLMDLFIDFIEKNKDFIKMVSRFNYLKNDRRIKKVLSLNQMITKTIEGIINEYNEKIKSPIPLNPITTAKNIMTIMHGITFQMSGGWFDKKKIKGYLDSSKVLIKLLFNPIQTI